MGIPSQRGLLGLCAGDPRAGRTFSGSAGRLFQALASLGHLAGVEDVTRREPRHELRGWVRTARRRLRAGSVLLDQWSPTAIERRSRTATALLERAGPVAGVLCYGTHYLPRTELPVGAALDATFAQLVRSGEGPFEHLRPAESAECIEAQRRILARCTVLFPRTEWCASSLVDDYGIPPERLVVTGAGPNLDAAREDRAYDARTLLFVGRDWVRKNGPLVLDAFRLARRARPELCLEVVGPRLPGPSEPGLTWHGPLEGARRSRLRDLYGRASLLVAPSRFEPYGIALLEAMAAGVPTITLDRCAAAEIVVQGVTGTRLQSCEPRTLSSAILDWLADPDRLAEAGRAARARIAGKLSWERAAQAIAASIPG